MNGRQWIDRLSDAELRARLRQRGVHESTVKRLVRRRDHPDEAAAIAWALRR